MTNPASPDLQQKPKPKSWRKHGFEFLSIFIAVVSAFALNNWNDNRRDAISENKILIEIYNGLAKDLADIQLNMGGHKSGISSCNYFKKVFLGQNVNRDSIAFQYHYLTRDFISIQNVAGYETLKSQGLELIQNDSLRLKIIGLYEYNYQTLRKLEEEYNEMQFQENYFKDINELLAPYFKFDNNGTIADIELPITLESKERNKALLYLWKIHSNRAFILKYYSQINSSILEVRKLIQEEIEI